MEPLKHNSEDPSRKLMHYRALKIHFFCEKRYKAAEINQQIFFYRLIQAMCGLAMVKNIYRWNH
jgi:hypothetical protein